MDSMKQPSAISRGLTVLGHDHAVRDDTDEFLLDTVCAFVVAAVRGGDTVIVMANAAHRQRFEGALVDAGVNVDVEQREGRYLAFDAARLLSLFMVDGGLSATLFRETVGSVLHDASKGGRQVRVYSEMGALLSDDGKADSASTLEGLWNVHKQIEEFQLLCACPKPSFSDEANPTGRARQTELRGEVVRSPPARAHKRRRQQSPALSGASADERIDRQRKCDSETPVVPAAPIRVLIIDDCSTMRLVLRHCLAVTNNFKVIGEAVDGRDGIDQAATKQPDIILLDCTMPVMDGIEAIPHLAQCSPGTLIIMLSAYDVHITGAQAIAAGAHAYVEKNLRPDQLVSRIVHAWEEWAGSGDRTRRVSNFGDTESIAN